MHSLNMQPDKKLVLTVIVVIFSVICVIGLMIILLCVCQNKNKMSQTFLSVFGDQSVSSKPETKYTLLEYKNSIVANFTNEDETRQG